MNIDEYRALKAQETQKASAPAPTPTVVETKPAEPIVETKPIEDPKPALPEKITIEGIGEIPIDELKNGYMRQSDYTQKTQEVARNRREVQDAVTFYEQIKANPELLTQITQNVQVPQALDPTTAQVLELKNLVYDMMLEKEITNLQHKYSDFEIKDVLAVAENKGLTNLEDAYFIAKAQKPAQAVNPADLEKQIREKIIREMEVEKNTQTIISTRGNTPVISDNSPVLSDAEKRVAKMMKLSDADYAKWRDADRKKK